MAKLKLPFELEKPSANEYVTQSSQIGHNGEPLDQALGNLSKLDNISKQSTQSEEEAFIFETDGGTQVGKIDANGADFTNLKRGGQQVARMTDLPTVPALDTSIGNSPSNSHTPSSKAVKDYVDANAMRDLPITKETTTSEAEELEFSNDTGSQSYAKIGSYGMKSKAYLDTQGNSVIPTKDTSIGETPSQTNVPTSKAVADYVEAHGGGGIGDLPISQEDTQLEEDEQVWGNDAETQEYAKMGPYGIKSKAYLDMNGNNVLPTDVVVSSLSLNASDTIVSKNISGLSHGYYTLQVEGTATYEISIASKVAGKQLYLSLGKITNSSAHIFFYDRHCESMIVQYTSSASITLTISRTSSINLEQTEVNIEVKKDGTGDYTDLRTALLSVEDSSPIKIYNILIYDDWNYTSIDCVNHDVSSVATNVLFTPPYTRLIGMNGRRKLSLIYGDAEFNLNANLIYWNGNSELINLHFYTENTRYAVHGESGTNSYAYMKATNCIFEYGHHDGRNWYDSAYAFAYGTYPAASYELTNCLFIGCSGAVFTHSNGWVSDSDINRYKNCKFITKESNKPDIRLSAASPLANSIISFDNCEYNSVSAEYGFVNTSSNFDEWTTLVPNVSVKSSTTISIASGSETVKAIKVVGAEIIEGTAIPVIIGNIVKLNSYYVGSKSIDATINKNLGVRLGDCSITNKILVFSVGGISKTVTLDKDYTEMSNSEIISEINTALGSTIVYDSFDYIDAINNYWIKH